MYLFEFPVDACTVLRVSEHTFWVQPEDMVSPSSVLVLPTGGPALLDGEELSLVGFDGVWDLMYYCPVGGRWEYESLRFEF